jgi:hypothetical protein
MFSFQMVLYIQKWDQTSDSLDRFKMVLLSKSYKKWTNLTSIRMPGVTCIQMISYQMAGSTAKWTI